jgi:hypothetical protein
MTKRNHDEVPKLVVEAFRLFASGSISVTEREQAP